MAQYLMIPIDHYDIIKLYDYDFLLYYAQVLT